jgi:uncharacterized protein
MKKINEKQALQILKSAQNIKKNCKDKVALNKILNHSKNVQRLAFKIAKEIKKEGHKVDLNFIKTASLLHDIGRFKCPPSSKRNAIRHGIEGAKLLRRYNLDNYALVAERHLGVGISKKDIKKQKLKLPLNDYLPMSIEEKVITYADNLVSDNEIKDINYVIKRFKKEIGEYIVERIIKLHNEIEELRGKKNFIKE